VETTPAGDVVREIDRNRSQRASLTPVRILDGPARLEIKLRRTARDQGGGNSFMNQFGSRRKEGQEQTGKYRG
jgi:hypothetical protein